MRAIPTSGGEARQPVTRIPATPLRRKLSWQVAAIVDWIERQMERRRSRLALLGLNDEQLRDIGLSRCDAYREGTRHFWE
jgi:uncharacterized protein YjiS (DUF1127 family)